MTGAPQGIEIRFMATGNPKRDFHPRHRHIPKIDPASLRRPDGGDPFLAIPLEDRPGDGTGAVRIRQVKAEHAAEILTCDPASGGASIHRLATDAEVAQHLEEFAARKAAEQAFRDGLARKQRARSFAEAVRAEKADEDRRRVLAPAAEKGPRPTQTPGSVGMTPTQTPAGTQELDVTEPDADEEASADVRSAAASEGRE